MKGQEIAIDTGTLLTDINALQDVWLMPENSYRICSIRSRSWILCGTARQMMNSEGSLTMTMKMQKSFARQWILLLSVCSMPENSMIYVRTMSIH